MNDELRTRSVELDDVNGFLETILASMGVGVVVVDANQVVQVWNAHATDLWGLRSDEVEGRHLMGLDVGLPLDAVKPALVAVLSGNDERAEVVVAALNRRGRRMTCRVTSLPLRVDDGRVTGAILLMDELAAGATAETDGGSDGSTTAGVEG